MSREIGPEAHGKEQVCALSPVTIDRLLRSYRHLGLRRPFPKIKPGSLL